MAHPAAPGASGPPTTGTEPLASRLAALLLAHNPKEDCFARAPCHPGASCAVLRLSPWHPAWLRCCSLTIRTRIASLARLVVRAPASQ